MPAVIEITVAVLIGLMVGVAILSVVDALNRRRRRRRRRHDDDGSR